jgi:hypothetical protein
VALELKLPHVRAHHARVENLAGPYELVTSRAFASLGDFVRLSGHALATGGVWMALKGKRPDAEIVELPADVRVFHVEQLTVPGLSGALHRVAQASGWRNVNSHQDLPQGQENCMFGVADYGAFVVAVIIFLSTFPPGDRH